MGSTIRLQDTCTHGSTSSSRARSLQTPARLWHYRKEPRSKIRPVHNSDNHPPAFKTGFANNSVLLTSEYRWSVHKNLKTTMQGQKNHGVHFPVSMYITLYIQRFLVAKSPSRKGFAAINPILWPVCHVYMLPARLQQTGSSMQNHKLRKVK